MKNYWLELQMRNPPILRHRGDAFVFRNKTWEKVRCGKAAGLLYPVITISGRCGILNEYQLLKTDAFDFSTGQPSAGYPMETELSTRFHRDDVMLVDIPIVDLPDGCQVFLKFCDGFSWAKTARQKEGTYSFDRMNGTNNEPNR
jgi:hypothetical protein